MSETAEPNSPTPNQDIPLVAGNVQHESGLDPKPSPGPKLKSVVKSNEVAHLVEFYEDLRAITTTTDQQQTLITRYLDAVLTRGKLFGCAWIEVSGQKTPEVAESRFKNPGLDNESMRQHIVESALLSLQNPTPQILQSKKMRGTLIACVPFFKDEQTTAIMCVIIQDVKDRCTEALLICQSIANHYDLWRSRGQLTSMALEVRSTASVLELVGKTESCETLKDACVKIANELQAFFRCDYVAVGLKKSKIASCRMMAISAMAEFDRQSRSTTLIQSAFDEAILRGKYTSFPAPPDKQASSPLSHKKLAQHMRCEAAITIPIRNQDEQTLGAITILGNRHLDRNPATRNLINALEHPIGSTVEVVRSAEGGWLRKLQRMLVSKEKTNIKWAVICLILISMIAMFIPVPYRINSSCTAEPVIRSFSVAPHDGLLENTFVEPGDVVHKGQVLAKMDGREIGFQMANVVADANKAATEYDSYLANGQIAKSIEADLRRQGFEAELSVLKNKQANLEIKSMTNGVILSGSLDRRENFPVTIGQTLYEIAPISPLRVELAIPADEIMHVEPNQKVKFRFDGFGTDTLTGKVQQIRPSSTIRDDQNVFIAEVVLENEERLVRPGMKGKAKIYGESKTLGWSLFHRPWEKIVTAIGF